MRRLSNESKDKAVDYIRMKCCRVTLQVDFLQTKNKHVTLKDLRNIKYQLTRGHGNNFSDVAELIEQNGIH